MTGELWSSAYGQGITDVSYAEKVVDAYLYSRRDKRKLAWAAGCLLFWTRVEQLRGKDEERLRRIKNVVDKWAGDAAAELMAEVRKRIGGPKDEW